MLGSILIARPMPKTRKGRLALAMRDSDEYQRRFVWTRSKIDRLLLSLSKTQGLSREDTVRERDALYHVDWKFLPDRLKE